MLVVKPELLPQEVELLWAEKREKEAQIHHLDLELQQVRSRDGSYLNLARYLLLKEKRFLKSIQ